MDKSKLDYSLYLCTDRKLAAEKTVEETIELAAKGGCTAIQLREKEISSREFFQTAVNAQKITKKYNIPLIINDRFDIALLAGADGVHLGQKDLPCKEVRKLAGDDFIIGVSAATVGEAIEAQAQGADYLGVGAFYPTLTKTNTRAVTLENLKQIRQAVDIPIIVIGGINLHKIKNFENTNINGFAVVSAIIAQKDITKAAKQLLEEIRRTI